MILLDTHIWIWMIQGDPRLPLHLRSLISTDPSEVLLSPVSVWEAILLVEKGRISIDEGFDPVPFFRTELRSTPLQAAPLTNEIALLSRELSFDHQDPADRFLAATAIAYGVALATVDEHLRALPWLKTT